MRRSRVAFALGVVVPLLVLGGCSDDDPEPRIAPTTSTSPSDTGSPSASPTGPVEPTMPAAAKGSGALAAQAFVSYWFELLSYSMITGDLTGVTDLSTRGCASCSAVTTKIADIYDKGGRIQTAGWHVAASAKAPDYDHRHPSFLIRVGQAKRILKDEQGHVVDRTPMAKVPMRVVLAGTDAGWRLATLEVLQ